MRKFLKTYFLIYICCSIIVLYVFYYLLLPKIQTCRNTKGIIIALNIKEIGSALLHYQEEYGYLPYHPLGEEYAFYLLKPFVKNVSVFDIPYSRSKKARWNDAAKKVENIDYKYINKPGIKWELGKNDNLIVVTEKPEFARNGWIKAMALDTHKSSCPAYITLLGKDLDKLCEVIRKIYK